MTSVRTPPQANPDALVSLRQVEVVYNKRATALDGISLDVRAGSITTLVGVNGAGKTTTLKAISGFIGGENAEVTEGHVFLAGEKITGLPPHIIASKGVALVPERQKIFEDLNVTENLRASGADREQIEETLERFERLGALRERKGGLLSGGERQLLAISMAMQSSPSLLLVDELSVGLAPRVIRSLVDEVVELHETSGLTVLLVEQNVAVALDIADYGYVIEDGRIVFEGTSDELKQHGDIQEFYLGVSEGEMNSRSYRDVKQYRRKRRWWG